jgi:hypothetical protein
VTNLRLSIIDARPAAQTAAPAVVFRLRVQQSGPGRIHAVALRAQVHILAAARRYDAQERHRLYELFGHPAQWDHTLRSLLWTHASTVVPSFDSGLDVDLPVLCTYDLEVAAAKYFHAVRDGTVPLLFLFSGTVFSAVDGTLRAEPVPWDCEAPFSMRADVWQDTMNTFFPGEGWIRLRRDTLDRLQAVRGRHAHISWDDTIDLLLAPQRAGEAV